MNIKAIFPAGATHITVHGLHQWDYGRQLEIQAADLPSQIEVHFACPGMKEAVVRVCNATSGAALATIPDTCLEQTAPITAWVFEINGTTGVTTKTITLPVIPRVRPQPGATVPSSFSDRYTELITAVNAAVAQLSTGDVRISNANHATTADTAALATRATNADRAATADHIAVAEALRLKGQGYNNGSALTPGLYFVEVSGYGENSSLDCNFTGYVWFLGFDVTVDCGDGFSISASHSGFEAGCTDGEPRNYSITATRYLAFAE